MLKPDQVWVYQTPFSSGLAALAYKYLFKSQLVFINADLWPESFEAAGININKNILQTLYAYSRWINRRANYVIATTQGMYQRYIKDGLAPKNLATIPLWVEGSWVSEVRAQVQETKKLTFIYAGNLGLAQDISNLLRAAAILNKTHLCPHISIQIYGTGAEENSLKRLHQQLALGDMVEFKGYVKSTHLVKVLTYAHCQLILLRADPLFKLVIPSKLAFSLGTGLPVICAVEGEAADITKSAGGFICQPGNPKALAEAILSVCSLSPQERQEIGKRQRLFFDKNLYPGTLLTQYIDLSQKLESMKH
jgi:glycosyltransferase involved in cell wall biosynthesis